MAWQGVFDFAGFGQRPCQRLWAENRWHQFGRSQQLFALGQVLQLFAVRPFQPWRDKAGVVQPVQQQGQCGAVLWQAHHRVVHRGGRFVAHQIAVFWRQRLVAQAIGVHPGQVGGLHHMQAEQVGKDRWCDPVQQRVRIVIGFGGVAQRDTLDLRIGQVVGVEQGHRMPVMGKAAQGQNIQPAQFRADPKRADRGIGGAHLRAASCSG